MPESKTHGLDQDDAIAGALSMAAAILSTTNPDAMTADDLQTAEFVSLAGLLGIIQGFRMAKGDAKALSGPLLQPYEARFREAFAARFRPSSRANGKAA